MFEDIGEYIKKTREERQSHLDLNENCIEIGGHSSTCFKGLLAYHLQTTIPTRNKIVLCHACNNQKCSNVKHLYWGTYRDNYDDYIATGALTWGEATARKYGRGQFAKVGSIGGKGNRGKPKSPEHRAKIAESLRKK